MATLAEQVQGERMARIVLSMIAEPNDLTTGYILGRHGSVATLSLVESDQDVSGLSRADVLLWRERLRARVVPHLLERVPESEQHGFGTLIPADREWPAGLDELGDRAPYVLWTTGASSFLTTALSDRVTITGARASSWAAKCGWSSPTPTGPRWSSGRSRPTPPGTTRPSPCTKS